MIIGVDMDSVLLDSGAPWKGYFDSQAESHGHKEEYQFPEPTWEYVKELCPTCLKECINSPDLLIKSELMPGALLGLEALYAHGHTLVLISHRPPEMRYVLLGRLSELGVARYFYHFHWGWESKAKMCEKFNVAVMVDDSPKNIVEVRAAGIACITFSWPYNVHIDGPRVRDWSELVRVIGEVSELLKGVPSEDIRKGI